MKNYAKFRFTGLLAALTLLSVLASVGCGPAAAPDSQPMPTTPASAPETAAEAPAPPIEIPHAQAAPQSVPTPAAAPKPLAAATVAAPETTQPVAAVSASGTAPDTSGAPDASSVAPQQQEYTWRDGDRTLTVVLEPELTVQDDRSVPSNEVALAQTGAGSIVPKNGASGNTEVSSGAESDHGQPVFRSASGSLMTLPGGVLVVLDAQWGAAAVTAFFARHGIALDRVSELELIPNGFFITTEPGFPSLNLANALAAQGGVEVSVPNWWRQVESQ